MINGKPPSGAFRLLLPSEADWSERKANADDGKPTAAAAKKGKRGV